MPNLKRQERFLTLIRKLNIWSIFLVLWISSISHFSLGPDYESFNILCIVSDAAMYPWHNLASINV